MDKALSVYLENKFKLYPKYPGMIARRRMELEYVEEFAHYTGRSLSSFKKDFSLIFNNTPSRWIVKKRLEEAKFLMDKYGEKPADVYLKVGFKNLSHFSTAFKKEFGFPPSMATTVNTI